ncbi:transglycosylase family protein [Streptomyces sp. NPDC046203]|uniref:transglycosylase family protein n=1 Tax=Streptomyces sp. NPDC046203 TaxID=3154602 RepID=UPI0033EBA864
MTGSALALPLLATGSASAADAQTWDRVAECESGGAWSANFGNGLYGGLQFTQDGWERHGGLAYAPSADLASRAQQIAIAEKAFAAGDTQWDTCAPIAGLQHDGKAPAVDPGSGPLPSASHSPVAESNRTDGLPSEAGQSNGSQGNGNQGNGSQGNNGQGNQGNGNQGDQSGHGQNGNQANQGNGQNGHGQGGQSGQAGQGDPFGQSQGNQGNQGNQGDQGGYGQGTGPAAPGGSVDSYPGGMATPATPDASAAPATPAPAATPFGPIAPGVSLPQAPTGLLAIPGVLQLPGLPGAPTTPAAPAAPAAPDTSVTPGLPTAPGTATPGQTTGQSQSHGQGQGQSDSKGKHRGDAAPEGTDGSDAAREAGRHAAPAGSDTDAADAAEGAKGAKGGEGGAAKSEVVAGNAVTADKADEYTVRPGDSLTEIARRTGLVGGWSALYDANKKELGSDPDLIVPGQSLKLGSQNSSSDE